MVMCDIDTNLLTAVQRFFVEQKFFDVKVTRNGRELLGCHKILLSSFSTHFEALLQGTEGCAILSLDAVDSKYVYHLSDIVRFMYGYSIQVDVGRCCTLYEAAEIFGVSSLLKLMHAKVPDWCQKESEELVGESVTFKPCAVGPLLLVIFQQFKNSDKFIDAEISRQNKVLFRCHKLVLAAFSAYFEMLLTSTEGCAILNLDSVNSLYVEQLDVLINLMYGKKPTNLTKKSRDCRNVVDFATLKEAVKFFSITFSWHKIENAIFNKKKRTAANSVNVKKLKLMDSNKAKIKDFATVVSAEKSDGQNLRNIPAECISPAPDDQKPSCSGCGTKISVPNAVKHFTNDSEVSFKHQHKLKSPILASASAHGQDLNDLRGKNDVKKAKKVINTKKQGRFVCALCGKAFSYKSLLSRHCHLKHSEMKPYQCIFCDHTTKEKGSLEIHIRSVHTHTKPFECSSCDHRCATKSQMARHLRTHTGEKPYACDKCDERFAERRDLNVHSARKHSQIVPFPCARCESKFYRKDHLIKHVKNVHNDVILA